MEPIFICLAAVIVAIVRSWFFITYGQVLQLNITNTPLANASSLILLCLPEVVIILVVGIGSALPISNFSTGANESITEHRKTTVLKLIIVFITKCVNNIRLKFINDELTNYAQLFIW